MHALPIISTIIHSITSIFGIFANVLLAFAVVRSTPASMTTYSFLILNFAMTDLFSSLASLIVQQRIIPGGLGLFYISYGPCRYLGSSSCLVIYSLMLHYYSHWLWSLRYSFWFRYSVIGSTQPSKCRVRCTILLVYIPSFLQFVFFCFTGDSEVLLKKRITQLFGYNMQNGCVSGHLSILRWPILGTILHMTLPVAPVYIAILWLKGGIKRKLDKEMSRQTRLVHQQLLKAITYQACIPILFLFAVLSYALGQLEILHHPIAEYSTFIQVGFVPALSPLSSFYCIRSYRKWLSSKAAVIKIYFVLITV